MKTALKIILVLLLVTMFISCGKNPAGPDEGNAAPGRRDYTWIIDTIQSVNPLRRLWGDSPTDIWGITSGSINDNIYHFDGQNWTTGKYPANAPLSIYGFSSNDIFICGQNGKIWHIDENGIKEIASLTKDGHSDIFFDNMWGNSSNDLYTFGAYPDENGYINHSVIAHFYNGNWEMLNTNGLTGVVEHLYMNNLDHKIYLQVASAHIDIDSTFIYEYFNGKYTELYGNVWTKGLQADISLINNKVYFIIGSEISTRISDHFQTVLKVDNPNFYQRIWGRSSKDIFLMMTDGLAHYNGKDIQYLFHYPYHTQIYGAALFQNDVFFLVSEPYLSLIYHGELK